VDLIRDAGAPMWKDEWFLTPIYELIFGFRFDFDFDEPLQSKINALVRKSDATFVKSAISALVERLERQEKSPEYLLLLEWKSLRQMQKKRQLTPTEESICIREFERLSKLDQQLRIFE
jgi:hypothetical protein